MMRAFWAVVAMSFRIWWRDKSSVFWGAVFPILLMALVGSVFGATERLNFNISLVSSQPNPLADGLSGAITSVPVFKVHHETQEAALEALRAGDRSLVVLLPQADTDPSVQVWFDESRGQVSQAAMAILRHVVDEVNKRLTGRDDVIVVTEESIYASRLSMFDFLLPGILAMTIMQTGVIGGSAVIANYRERHLFKRVLATPVSPVVFIGGLVGRFTVINLLQAAIIFVVATFVFQAKTVGSLLSLGVLAIVGSIAFLSIGFAISTVAKTTEAANMLASLVNFPMMFMSGTFWPKELFPETMGSVIAALPLTSLVDAMRGVGTRAEALGTYWPGIAYLCAWSVICLVIATRRFRWE